MSDPRKGLPSASSIERRFLCPGSANAERGLPVQSNDDADSGTRIHAALAGDVRELEKLSSDEHAVYERMREEAANLVERLGFDPNHYIAEQRLWFDEIFSGQPDRVYLKDGSALVIDFKTGHREVTDAARNPQLAVLGVLAVHTYGVARVTVAIVPRFGKVKEIAEYDLESATAALHFIQSIIVVSEDPEAKRVPGEDQCRYCLARLRCPEFQAHASTALALKKETLPDIPNEQLVQALDRIGMAKSLIKALEAEARRRIATGDEEFNKFYYISEGRTNREIVDLPTLYQRCKELNISDATFTGACSIPIGEVKGEKITGIKGLVHTALKLKGTALDKKVDELLVGCVEESKTAGSLKRKE